MSDPNLFKEKLFNHTLPVKEGLWDAIESKLPPKKDDRLFPIFWLILFASALLGGALMIGYVHPPKEIPATTEINSITSSPTSESQSSKENIGSTLSAPNAIEESNVNKNQDTNTAAKQNRSAISNSNRRSPNSKEELTKTNLPSTNESIMAENELPIFESYTNPPSRNTRTTSFLPNTVVGTSTSEEPENEIFSLNPDPNCYKFGGTGGTFALSADFFAGPGFSPSSFEDTGGENSVYADARDATERNQYAWAAGVRINLHLRNGLAARLGVMYEQTGDIFDYTDTLATQHSIRIDSFFASDGTFLYVDSSSVLIFGTLIKKIHNTYRRWDIPLLIGYELPMGRSTLMINAGPVFNLSSTHEGQILDPNLHPAYITPGAPNELHAYKTSLGISIYLGAGAVFPLNDSFSALVEPRFLYRIKPVTLESYELEEHRHFVGLNLGIRYHLN